MDIFFVNPIDAGGLPSGCCSAEVDGQVYFDSENILYTLRREDLFLKNASLRQATLVKTPAGRVIGLFSFSNRLYLITKEDEAPAQLFSYQDALWVPIFQANFPQAPSFCRTTNEKFVIFWINEADGSAAFFALDNKAAITKICTLDKQKGLVQSIFQHGRNLYVAMSNRPREVLCARIFNFWGQCRPQSKISFKPVLSHPVYGFLNDRDSVYFCQDGQTAVLDKNGTSVFTDTKKGQSGFQIAARVSVGRKHHILGTWRRDEDNPSACLYILKNFKQLFKYTDPLPFKKENKWTGFQYQDVSSVSASEVLLPCFGSNPVFIAHFTSQAAANAAIPEGTPIVYQDRHTVVYTSTSRQRRGSDDRQNSEQEAASYRKTLFLSNHYLKPVTTGHPTRVYLTFDIEQHVAGEPYCLTGRGLPVECGTYWIMDQLERHGFRGVFFVNIYEHTNFKDNLMENMVRHIHERGHEVGLHTHKNYVNPFSFYPEEIGQCSFDQQCEIIKYGKDFIEGITGLPLRSFRAGGYAINAYTLPALEASGIPIDSSLFQCHIKDDITYKTKNRPTHYGDILEIPVTTHSLYGNLSKIDINWHTSPTALMDILTNCRRYGLDDLVFMGHSFSFLKFSPNPKDSAYNFQFTGKRYLEGINRQLINNFIKFLVLLQAEKEQFDVILFKDLDLSALPDFGQQSDNIPFLLAPPPTTQCPVCGEKVTFQPYRARNGALCPNCKSLERTRLSYLYLSMHKKIELQQKISVLHFGPNLRKRDWLKSLPNIDYISADPYSPADFKVSIEHIVYADSSFDLIICIGVMMHVLDDYRAFAEMYRVLKEGGELILWLGGLSLEKTKEAYDRQDYHRMVANDFSHPDNIHEAKTIERDGKILYNPRSATRIYGKDVIDLLKKYGFTCEIITSEQITANPSLFGIPHDDLLLICRK